MYVATTYDRGAHWTTVDTTPTDPVQRGCVWNSGGSNPCRNLLDFNGMTIDRTGRVMVGFADGCVPASVEPKNSVTGKATNDCSNSLLVAKNGLTDHGAIVRQQSGKGLLRAFDPVSVVRPVTPPVTVPGTKPGNGGGLAATGGAPAVAALGGLLIACGWFLRRRRNG
jgi:hypothetical protein